MLNEGGCLSGGARPALNHNDSYPAQSLKRPERYSSPPLIFWWVLLSNTTSSTSGPSQNKAAAILAVIPKRPLNTTQTWMLTLLRCSRKTKTIKGADSAGDDHRPARRCRRWRKPLLKLTSLITSQLSGAVWHSPAFPRVRKKAHTHGTKINRSRRENGIFRVLLVNGRRSIWLWERFWSRLECGFVLFWQVSFYSSSGSGGVPGAMPAVARWEAARSGQVTTHHKTLTHFRV